MAGEQTQQAAEQSRAKLRQQAQQQGSGSGSGFQNYLNSLTTQQMGFTPTSTRTTYLQQTTIPDIESMVNSLFIQLTGRYATADEIKKYGEELLKAERANPGMYTGETTYQETGKRATVSGTQVSRGVAEQAFLQSQISRSAQAGAFSAATNAFDLLTQMARKDAGAA